MHLCGVSWEVIESYLRFHIHDAELVRESDALVQEVHETVQEWLDQARAEWEIERQRVAQAQNTAAGTQCGAQAIQALSDEINGEEAPFPTEDVIQAAQSGVDLKTMLDLCTQCMSV